MPSSGSADELRARLADVFVEPGQRALADGDHAVLLALALADHHRAALDVEIVELEVDHFQPPHSGGVEASPGSRGRAARADRRRLAACITCSASEAVSTCLGSRWPSRGSSISDAGLCRMWFCRVIHLNHTRNGTRRACWLRKRQRLAVLLAVVEQISLIAFEHGPRDLGWLGEAALLAPVEEAADVRLAVLDRVFGVVLARAARSRCSCSSAAKRRLVAGRFGFALRSPCTRAITSPPHR